MARQVVGAEDGCQDRNSTGDPAPRWEVARVWRLGRRNLFVHVGGTDPPGKWVPGRPVSGEATLYADLIHHVGSGTPHWLIGLRAASRGKARADGEPASVADEVPARNSAGPCGPVD